MLCFYFLMLHFQNFKSRLPELGAMATAPYWCNTQSQETKLPRDVDFETP